MCQLKRDKGDCKSMSGHDWPAVGGDCDNGLVLVGAGQPLWPAAFRRALPANVQESRNISRREACFCKRLNFMFFSDGDPARRKAQASRNSTPSPNRFSVADRYFPPADARPACLQSNRPTRNDFICIALI